MRTWTSFISKLINQRQLFDPVQKSSLFQNNEHGNREQLRLCVYSPSGTHRVLVGVTTRAAQTPSTSTFHYHTTWKLNSSIPCTNIWVHLAFPELAVTFPLAHPVVWRIHTCICSIYAFKWEMHSDSFPWWILHNSWKKNVVTNSRD